MRKLILLTTLLSVGFAQDMHHEQVLESTDKKEKAEVLEDKRKRVFEKCKDFPSEKFGKPEYYVVFQPALLGISLRSANAEVKRLEDSLVAKSYVEGIPGRPYTSIKYLAYHVRVPMTLKEFVETSPVVNKIRAEEEFKDKLFFLAKRADLEQYSVSRGHITARKRFEGVLQRNNVVGERLVLYPPSLAMSSLNMRSEYNIAPFIFYAYYPDSITRDYCIEWEDKSYTDRGRLLMNLFGLARDYTWSGEVTAPIFYRLSVFKDLKVHKSAIKRVQVEKLGSFLLYINAMRNDKSKAIPKGEDKGLVISIDDGISGKAMCFDNNDVEIFKRKWEESGKKEMLVKSETAVYRDREVISGTMPPKPEHISVCGYMPIPALQELAGSSKPPKITGIEVFDRLWAKMHGLVDESGRLWAIESIIKSWYPYPVCIEFKDYTCTLPMSPITIEEEYFRSSYRVPTEDDLQKATTFLQHKAELLRQGGDAAELKPPQFSSGTLRPETYYKNEGIREPLTPDMQVLIGILESLARKSR